MKHIRIDSDKSLKKKAYEEFKNNCPGKEVFYVFVYASWCGHCNVMKPELEKALKKIDSDSILVSVSDDAFALLVNDPETDKVFGKWFKKIEGFPCLVRVSKRKTVTEFKKERTAENITAFLSK
jgi:thiol-disulfide isomerase/thioredoxin